MVRLGLARCEGSVVRKKTSARNFEASLIANRTSRADTTTSHYNYPHHIQSAQKNLKCINIAAFVYPFPFHKLPPLLSAHLSAPSLLTSKPSKTHS